MPRSVLVVDDDSSFRELAMTLVRSWGHEVVGGAGSVAEAMTRVTELRPDTVLLDIGLPDGDGFQLTARLSQLPWHPRVLLISSDSDAATDAGLGAGDTVDVDAGHQPDHGVTMRLISDAILLDHRLIPQVLEAPQLLPELREWMTARSS